jgi:hypothetical protein
LLALCVAWRGLVWLGVALGKSPLDPLCACTYPLHVPFATPTWVRFSALLVWVASALVACRRGDPGVAERLPDFYGARLGMAPRDVRAAFAEPGAWTTVPAKELTLSWKRTGTSEVSDAEFEFHNGLLVAFRATVAASAAFAKGMRVVTPAAVRVCSGEGRERSCRAVARDCPTHADEVRALLGPG